MIFENVKEVSIKAVNGKVEIEGWGDDHVEVNYILHGEVNVKVEQKGSMLIIMEEPKKKFLNLLRESGWAEIEVKVPRSAFVRAHNVNGELRARGVHFEDAATVNGEMNLEECEAEVLNTVNGDLDITIEELEDDVEVDCVNGDVRLKLTDFCDARIVSKTARGDIELVGIDPENPVIGTGEYEVKVSTVNGDMRVELV